MNPFEIRLELIKVAQKYMETQFQANSDLVYETTMEMIKQGKATAENLQKLMPKQYSAEEVLEQAKKLYSFVSNAK